MFTVTYATITDKGVMTGRVDMRLTIQAQAEVGRRTLPFLIDVDQVTTSGKLANGLDVAVGLTCTGTPSPCNQKQAPGSVMFYARPGSTLHQWFLPYSEFGKNTDVDKRGYQTISPFTEARLTWVYGTERTYRCDSATYTGDKHRACSFSDVPGILTYRLSDPDVDKVAKHIKLAYEHPDKTYPKRNYKYIPDYLTRLRPSNAQIAANRRTAVKVCQKQWPGYAKKSQDCDEFPFASTHEGASKAAGNYSAKALSLHDNRSAGVDLKNWYIRDHILAGDTFGVNIAP